MEVPGLAPIGAVADDVEDFLGPCESDVRDVRAGARPAACPLECLALVAQHEDDTFRLAALDLVHGADPSGQLTDLGEGDANPGMVLNDHVAQPALA